MAWFQNACKRTLIFVLLTWGTIFFVPVSALANGVITVTTPLNGATVTVPFDVHFTYSGTDTYTKLWIDGVAIISDHNGSVFDYTVTSLAAGQHTLSLQAHDASSNTTVTLHETITVSTTPPTTGKRDSVAADGPGRKPIHLQLECECHLASVRRWHNTELHQRRHVVHVRGRHHDGNGNLDSDRDRRLRRNRHGKYHD